MSPRDRLVERLVAQFGVPLSRSQDLRQLIDETLGPEMDRCAHHPQADHELQCLICLAEQDPRPAVPALVAYMAEGTTPEQRGAAFLRTYAERLRNKTAVLWEIPNTVASTLEDIAQLLEGPGSIEHLQAQIRANLHNIRTWLPDYLTGPLVPGARRLSREELQPFFDLMEREVIPKIEETIRDRQDAAEKARHQFLRESGEP